MRAFALSSLTLLVWAAVVFPSATLAQEKPLKVAILNIQQAIAQCNEGQQAAKALQAKFAQPRADLEKQQREINDLQNQLRNQEKTINDDTRNKMLRTIDEKTRVFNRANEDATSEFQQAEQDAINEIGRKMLGIISDHAQKNGYTIVLDVSSPQTPVLYADSAIDITPKIIELYNAATPKAQSGSAGEPSSSKPPAPRPATGTGATPKPPEPKPATP